MKAQDAIASLTQAVSNLAMIVKDSSINTAQSKILLKDVRERIFEIQTRLTNGEGIQL